jgi:hypothetical protein
MRKDEIRSLVINTLPKYDKVAKYHPRFIDASIEKVINILYTESFANDKLSLQKYTKQYGYTVPLTVSLEASTNLYYTTLPAMIVPIDDDASGVRRISTIAQGGFTFFPMDARGHDFIRSGSYVNTVTTKIGYSVNQTRIEYFNMSAAIVAQGVRADILVPFSVYADSDTVLIPETTDKNGIPFVDMVIRVLMSLPPTDMLDNNQNAKQ